MIKRNVMHGVYNALNYYIFLNGKLVYTAGNNPQSSDASDTLPEAQGVGLERMKGYCEYTLREMCLENYGAVNAGVEHKDILDPEELETL